jgi:predicted lipid-binding transport protein (Tim44 family)
MRRLLWGVVIAVLAFVWIGEAVAQRRLGGGRNLGQQSPQVQSVPARPAAAAVSEAPAATAQQQPAATRNSWLGALAGAAAGLGLVSLVSRFGLMASGMLLVLVALALGFTTLLRRRVLAAAQRARADRRAGTWGETWQGIGGPSYAPRPATIRIEAARPRVDTPADAGLAGTGSAAPGSVAEEFAQMTGPAPRPWGVADDFDIDAFLRTAEEAFGRLQAAWDRADLAELRKFTSDDMHRALAAELQTRVGPNRTDVVALDSALLGIESSAVEHLASVRFTGAVRTNGELERVDEVWNLAKPVDGSSGWLLAGIQQLS